MPNIVRKSYFSQEAYLLFTHSFIFYTSFWCKHIDINLTTTNTMPVKPLAFIIYQRMIQLKYVQSQYEKVLHFFSVNHCTKIEFYC